MQHGSDLKFQRRQEMWDQRNGPERRGGGEEGLVPQSLGSRGSHHQAAPHGQGNSASGSRKINGNTTRAWVAPGSCLWCTEIHHRTAPGWGESQPAIPAAQGRVRTGNIMLSLTALQKEKLLWCLVTEFNRFQSVITVQNHAWFVLWGVSPSGFFSAYALNTKLKTAHLYRAPITYLIITFTLPTQW